MRISHPVWGSKNITVWLLFLISWIGMIAPGYSHPGGHFQNEAYPFNTWKLKSGKSIQGNFLLSIGDTILLEQSEGRAKKLALKDIAPQDQRLALFKIKRLKAYNEPSDTPFNIEQPALEPWAYFDISIKLALILLLLGMIFFNKRSVSLSARISFSVIILCMITVSFKDHTQALKTDPMAMDAAFSDYKPSVKTSWDDHYFYVESNGLPNHQMMVGISSWQQQVPLPQQYTNNNHWSITLHPEYASQPLSLKNNFMRGAIAIAVNGIPIFNALNNRGEDAYTMGELDKWGGHCGRGDDYHYHIAPAHLANKNLIKPIAYALDGFAMYGAVEPDGSAMKILDSCHGHTDQNGSYHYHGTQVYPYTIAYIRGKVSIDDSKPAPENQISPQAMIQPVRPPGRPLRGATIVDFTSNKPQDYTLKYQIGNQFGWLNYSWDNDNFYFTAMAPDGSITRNAYRHR